MQAFLTAPAAWGEAGRLASLVAPGLRAATLRRLLDGRTAERARALLGRSLPAGDAGALDPVDAALLVGPAAWLDSAASAAGAVCQARLVRALVVGADIAAFVGRFGERSRDWALRQLPPDDIERASGTLLDAVSLDARRARESWLFELPDWAAERLRLSGLDWPACEPPQRASRAALLRSLAAELVR